METELNTFINRLEKDNEMLQQQLGSSKKYLDELKENYNNL